MSIEQIAAVDDGGSAFPEAGLAGLPNGEFLYGRSGMSLRDYFAARATDEDIREVIVGNLLPLELRGKDTREAQRRAAARFIHADLMLKARSA